MLIARDQELAGMPAPRLRGLMRKIRLDAVTVAFIGELLDVSEKDAGLLVDRLVNEGLLRPVAASEHGLGWTRFAEADEGKPSLELWKTTIAGNALAKARVGKPMVRRKAQALLDGLIDRAVAINDDPRQVFWVEVIELFGSFANPDCETVGDVDARVVYDRRVAGDRYIELAEEAARRAEGQGRHFSTHFDRITYIETEFRRRLKGRSPRLDVQFDLGRRRPLPEGTTAKVVYSRARS